MLVAFLSLGLLFGGVLGFLLGARPGSRSAVAGSTARSRPAFAGRSGRARIAFPPRPAGAHPGAAVGALRQPRALAPTRDSLDFLYPLAAAFFAGFVFTTLVTDALTHSHGTLAAFAAGAIGMAVLSRYVIKRDPCCEGGHDHKGLSGLSLVAMAVCSVNDGLLLGLAQPAWLSGLNLGMFLHKVTSSFAIAQVMLRGGHRGAGLYAFGAAYALVSPAAMLGAESAARFLPGMEMALAFSAGILAYVSLSSLVPHAGGILRRRPSARLGFAAALLLSLGLGLWHRGMHGHAHGLPPGQPHDEEDGGRPGHADDRTPPEAGGPATGAATGILPAPSVGQGGVP